MSRKNLLITKIICTALVLICLAGCKNRENIEETVTFTDGLNREVTVKKGASRCAAVLGSFADIWILAGGEVCASTDDGWEDFKLPLENAENLGKLNKPDVEKIISSKPDIVLLSASLSKHVELKPILESAGLKVAYFDVNTFEEYLSMLKILTDITGKKDLYEKNGEALRQRIEEIKKAEIPEEKRTVLFLRASAGYIRAKNSENSVLGEMLKEFNCINIADSDEMLLENLSIESIFVKNPYRIFIVQTGDDENATKENLEKMMQENPLWQELDAVKNNRVHYMEKRLFNLKPNVHWGEAYEILKKILTQ